jgi:hypothetical protein
MAHAHFPRIFWASDEERRGSVTPNQLSNLGGGGGPVAPNQISNLGPNAPIAPDQIANPVADQSDLGRSGGARGTSGSQARTGGGGGLTAPGAGNRPLGPAGGTAGGTDTSQGADVDTRSAPPDSRG